MKITDLSISGMYFLYAVMKYELGINMFLACDAAWLAEWFLVLQKIVVHSSSTVEDEGNMILQNTRNF
jgi:hypothetical protein